jgi:hypothetical protein
VKLDLLDRVFNDLSDIASGNAKASGLQYLGAR